MSNHLFPSNLTARPGKSSLDGRLSPAARAELAASVALLFAQGRVEGADRDTAIGILEILSRDLELEVREALSVQVQHCAYLPHSIARTLVQDLDPVALPIIQNSPVLTEADLLEIVRAGSQARRVAVARRESVSVRISDALAETDDKIVVTALLDNMRAQIGSTSLDRILKKFGADEQVQALIVERPALPMEIITRIIDRLGNTLKQRMIERHDIPEVLVSRLVSQSRERTIARSIPTNAALGAVEAMAIRLHADGTLTPTFLLRALCMGQLSMFIAGMAAHASVPASEARSLIDGSARAGLAKLYADTTFPSDLFTAFRIALDVALQADPKDPADWSGAHTDRILQRIVATYASVAPGDLDSVLSQLARRAERRGGVPGMRGIPTAAQLHRVGTPGN